MPYLVGVVSTSATPILNASFSSPKGVGFAAFNNGDGLYYVGVGAKTDLVVHAPGFSDSAVWNTDDVDPTVLWFWFRLIPIPVSAPKPPPPALPLKAFLGSQAHGDHMDAGEFLKPDTEIRSPNGRYAFRYPSSVPLGVWDHGGEPSEPAELLWYPAFGPSGGFVCLMQVDGNLVVYTEDGRALWQTNSWGNPGSRLVVQDDGNVVIYRPNRTAAWETHTWLPNGPSPQQGDRLLPGEVLVTGLKSPNGRYHLIYHFDGDVALWETNVGIPAKALWHSGTSHKGDGVCIMQTDGNLVIYARGHYLWSSNTQGNPGSHLLVQDDGNVVIYRPDGRYVWQTETWH